MATMKIDRILRELMTVTRSNQTELGDSIGVSQPTISRWLTGSIKDLTHDNRARIIALANKLGIVEDTPNGHDLTVPLVGYVGAGGEVAYSEGQGPFGEVEMPPIEAGSDTVAVVVRGDSMAGQLEDGWIVYYDNRRDPPTNDLFNKLCIIGLTDGRVLIKKLLPGSKAGLFHLFSTNATPLLDQPVEWAARIAWIAPK